MRAVRLLAKIGIIAVIAVFGVISISSGFAYAEGTDGSEETTEGEETTTSVNDPMEPQRDPQCASILKGFCDSLSGDNPDGELTIREILTYVIIALSIGIGTLGTVGIIICAYTIMTARDNEAAVTKAKARLIEIVIGVLVWGLGSAVLLLFIPDPEAARKVMEGSSMIQVEEMR